MTKFGPPVYNMVAKRLREKYPMHGSANLQPYKHERRIIEELALDFAEAFKRDNKDFKHLEFLDQCSPDPEVYPFSELWGE